ncbi:anti-phage protein KwaA [Aeromonas sp. s3]|uniref:anti-phage protein KwaA n=1 Tax=Aeromonas TaxID=642 RepID=UPI0034A4952E
MNTKEKIKLYILSLMFLFVMVIFLSIDIKPPSSDSEVRYNIAIYYILSNWLPILMFFSIIYCEFIRREFDFELNGSASDSLLVIDCKSENYEHLSFLATYIVPFAGLNFDSPLKLLAYLFLLVVIGIIFVRTDKYYTNPTLSIYGYKLYRATLADHVSHYHSVIVITKHDLKKGQNIAYKFISEDVCFARKINND